MTETTDDRRIYVIEWSMGRDLNGLVAACLERGDAEKIASSLNETDKHTDHYVTEVRLIRTVAEVPDESDE